MSKNLTYKKILLKISGEFLEGLSREGSHHEKQGQNIHFPTLDRVAGEIISLSQQNVEICLVVGGGNIFRGTTVMGGNVVDRATGDYMGMLATVMNGMALSAALEKRGQDTRVLSAIPMQTICEPYIRRRAMRHMAKGRIVLFVGGTGNPYVTTDTAAALRAAEMGCDALFKATNVDGVYDKDPKLNNKATQYPQMDFKDIISGDLRVMDMSAVSLCRENNIPIVVFSIQTKGSLQVIWDGKGGGTLITHMNNKGGRA